MSQSTLLILSFCANCGQLLPTGLGQRSKDDQKCENCAANVSERSSRLEGTFSIDEGNAMMLIFGE